MNYILKFFVDERMSEKSEKGFVSTLLLAVRMKHCISTGIWMMRTHFYIFMFSKSRT